MKTIAVLCLSLLLLAARPVHQIQTPELVGSGTVRAEIRLKPSQKMRDIYQVLTQNHFDVAGVNFNQGTLEVITTQSGLSLLQKLGLQKTQLSLLAAPDARYLTPEKVEFALTNLNQLHPQFTHLEQIGTSLQGRAIWGLLVSSQPQDPWSQQRPTLLIDGLHHAREIMTSEVVLDVAETLLDGLYRKDPQVTQLLQTWNVWVVPMLNVDGADIVFHKDNMWRKNARANGRKAHGVDINRNYDFQWNSCKGSSGVEMAQDFHGTNPASEPETQALQSLAQKIRPTGYLSYHSFSELILYAYGCKGQFAADKNLVIQLADELAQILPTDDGKKNYKPGTPWDLLYNADGTSMDYMVGSFGSLAYTFEINQSFQPSYTLRDPTLRKHRKAWLYLMLKMNDNLLVVDVKDGRTGAPARATLDFSGQTPMGLELPLATNLGGRFFKVLLPGNYSVRATLADGRTQTVNVQKQSGGQVLQLLVP